MALRVCRDYGQPFSWWTGLSKGDRLLYIADLYEQDIDAEEARRRAERRRR